MFKKIFVLFLSLTFLCGAGWGFTFKKIKFSQKGLLIKYKSDSKLRPLRVEKDGAFFKVYMNVKQKKDLVISAQRFINRWLDTIILEASKIVVEQDKKGVFLKIPFFKKSYRYEALINGEHFWFYRK